MRYRLKAAEVEAVQFTGDPLPGVSLMVAGPRHPDKPKGTPLWGEIATPSGRLVVRIGDWILGRGDYRYVFAPDEFDRMYEPAT